MSINIDWIWTPSTIAESASPLSSTAISDLPLQWVLLHSKSETVVWCILLWLARRRPDNAIALGPSWLGKLWSLLSSFSSRGAHSTCSDFWSSLSGWVFKECSGQWPFYCGLHKFKACHARCSKLATKHNNHLPCLTENMIFFSLNLSFFVCKHESPGLSKNSTFVFSIWQDILPEHCGFKHFIKFRLFF